MTIAIFYDTDGRITYSGDLDEMSADDIAEQLVDAVDYLESDDYPDEGSQWVDAGDLADRPAIDVAPQWAIASDGVDSIWLEAPAGTVIIVNVDENDRGLAEDEMPANGLFVFRTLIKGEFRITAIPPFPWQFATVGVTAGGDIGSGVSPPGSPPTQLTMTLDMPVIEGLAGEARPRFNYWSWEESVNPEHASYEVTFYTSEADANADTNGSTIGPILENFYQDREDTDIDDGLWARVADVDADGNRSTKSDWAKVTARGVQSGDIEQSAVIPSKAYRGAVNNVVRDFEMLERDLLTFMHYTKAAGSGTKTAVAEPNISRIVNDVTGLTYIVGTSLYKWQAVAASLTDVIEIETENLISVVGAREYMIEGAIRNVNRFTGVGATFDSMTLTVQWWRVDSGGNLVRHSADSQQITSPSSANNVFEFPVVAPSQAMFASLIWTSIPANSNGQLPTIQVGGPVIRELPRYLESSWSGIFGGTNTSWSSGRRALAIADIRTGTAQFPIKREPRLALFHGRFRNAAAGGMSYEVQLCEYDVPSGVTSSFVIDSVPLYRLSTDDVGNVTLFDDGTAQGYFADAYALVLSANQTGNDIRAIKLIADLRFC